MPARPDDPEWLKSAYAEGRITERVVNQARGSGSDRGVGEVVETSETEFEEQIVAVARSLGWSVIGVRRNVAVQRADGSVFHCTPWLYDGEGCPDLVLVRDRIVFMELKSESGRMRPKQEAWFHRLKNAGAEVYIMRPSDWPLIREVLK